MTLICLDNPIGLSGAQKIARGAGAPQAHNKKPRHAEA